MILNLTLPLPETTNHTYRTGGGRWYKSAKAKAWTTIALWDIRKQNRPKQTFSGDVAVDITFCITRDRDVDGGIKPVLDVLETAGVYGNDSQVQVLHVRKMKMPAPATLVTIDAL